jgi:hypothetical protein
LNLDLSLLEHGESLYKLASGLTSCLMNGPMLLDQAFTSGSMHPTAENLCVPIPTDKVKPYFIIGGIASDLSTVTFVIPHATYLLVRPSGSTYVGRQHINDRLLVMH